MTVGRVRWNAIYDLWTSIYNYATILVPSLLTAPRYFRGEIEFGVISQVSFAFSTIESALSVIINNLTQLSGLAAETERLEALQKAMEAADESERHAEALSGSRTPPDSSSPDGEKKDATLLSSALAPSLNRISRKMGPTQVGLVMEGLSVMIDCKQEVPEDLKDLAQRSRGGNGKKPGGHKGGGGGGSRFGRGDSDRSGGGGYGRDRGEFRDHRSNQSDDSFFRGGSSGKCTSSVYPVGAPNMAEPVLMARNGMDLLRITTSPSRQFKLRAFLVATTITVFLLANNPASAQDSNIQIVGFSSGCSPEELQQVSDKALSVTVLPNRTEVSEIKFVYLFGFGPELVVYDYLIGFGEEYSALEILENKCTRPQYRRQHKQQGKWSGGMSSLVEEWSIAFKGQQSSVYIAASETGDVVGQVDDSRLTVLEWFTDQSAAAMTVEGAGGGVLSFNGQLYDNVFTKRKVGSIQHTVQYIARLLILPPDPQSAASSTPSSTSPVGSLQHTVQYIARLLIQHPGHVLDGVLEAAEL
eukprot:gene18046-24463_t